MAHPIIEEMNRCFSLEQVQSHAFRRWQRVLRDEVQPQLDQVNEIVAANVVLTEENAALRAEVERLTAKKAKKETATV